MFLCPLCQIDKHWSEKQLKHMTERDWRIFREDFNISYRGHNPTLPLRSWDEADLPGPLAEVRGESLGVLLFAVWLQRGGEGGLLVSGAQRGG